MMVALWFLAIPFLTYGAWFVSRKCHERRAQSHYAVLEAQAGLLAFLWAETWNHLWSRASVQERGWLTEPQRAELDAINERIGAINEQMAECAEEF